ncbi:type II toxin-antitoxin system RelE/ParE family toxin [Mycobacterium sp. KBS0706]
MDIIRWDEIAVNVLHCLQKKTQATSRRDIELARSRFLELVRGAE